MYKPEVESRVRRPGRAFEMGLDIGVMGLLKRPRRLYWPNLRDPDDAWILDLALEAAFGPEDSYIVSRDQGVLEDAPKSGFKALDPLAFLRAVGL